MKRFANLFCQHLIGNVCNNFVKHYFPSHTNYSWTPTIRTYFQICLLCSQIHLDHEFEYPIAPSDYTLSVVKSSLLSAWAMRAVIFVGIVVDARGAVALGSSHSDISARVVTVGFSFLSSGLLVTSCYVGVEVTFAKGCCMYGMLCMVTIESAI